MRGQYSDTILAVDTGSPLTSVAVGRAGEVLAAREDPDRDSSGSLLAMIDGALAEAGMAARDLGLMVALQGPGSFTGLRIGLATLLGLHQALGVPATAVPTFEALALAAGRVEGTLVAAIDALRGEWFAQTFRGGRPVEPLVAPALVRPEQIAELEPAAVVGFGVGALSPAMAGRRIEPGALAPALFQTAVSRSLEIDAGRLTRPLYLRPPAVTARS